MKKVIIYIIRIYQMLPLTSHSFCRCQPTCSEYMIEAIQYYGVIKGIKLGFRRIIKCRPNGLYGYQPLLKDVEE